MNFPQPQDGAPATICITVDTASAIPMADIVWVVDRSTSMNSGISQIKANINNFNAQLAGQNIDYRNALVTFTGTTGNPQITNYGFAASTSIFQGWLTAVTTANGVEPALEALQNANTLPWRTDASKTMILVTDERVNCAEYGSAAVSMAVVASTLNSQGVVIHGVTANLAPAASPENRCNGMLLPPMAGGTWLDYSAPATAWSTFLTDLGRVTAQLTHLVIHDPLPSGLVPVPGTYGSATLVGNELTWKLPAMDRGLSWQVCFQAQITAPPGTTLSNTAYFSADQVPEISSSSVSFNLNTPTFTRTFTPSFTPTFTRTFTPTFTPSFTPSFTRTFTPSFTPTFTPSFTPSFTRTFTPSFTATFTPSFTPTFTPSFTATFTPTFTPSFTPSFTPTFTPSHTSTFTPSFTPSFTPTETPSFTPSFTPTDTPTDTPTFTPSFTPTDTPTFTPSFTPSFTPTDTPTETPSFTPTDTPTFTPTFTSTSSDTPTFTPSFTASFTPTVTSSVTPTYTPTSTPTLTVAGIVVFPNPFDPDRAVRGTLKVQGIPAGATFSVYTVSGELVHRETGNGAQVEWNGSTLEGRAIASGTYYYIVRDGAGTLASGPLVIWRGSK